MELRDADVDVSGRPSNRAPSRPQPDCLLSIGSQRLAAVLGDEWDNGVSVTVQGSPAFWVEDTGVLQTADLEIDVRVSQIVRLEADEDELAPTNPAFRIGLVRLNQIAVKLRSGPGPAPSLATEARDDSAPNVMSCLRPRFCLSKGKILGIFLVLILVIVVAAAWQFFVRKAGVTDPLTRNADGTATLNSAVQPGTSPAEAGISSAILRLPGVESFLNPEVAKRLQLTQSQTEALGRLHKTTQEALEDLEKYWGSTSRLEFQGRRDVIQNAAQQEALRLLSDEQRRQWEAMSR
jgi:hypothetical protein